MTAKIILRAAAIIIFLHDIGHTMAVLTWKDDTDPKKMEVIKQMTENKFPFMATSRSMGEYFEGFGIQGTLALLLITLILWYVSDARETNKNFNKKIILTVSIILLVWGISELIYFFPLAASFSLLSSLLGFYSLLLLNKPGNVRV
jgi:uncharacterized membrane protein